MGVKYKYPDENEVILSEGTSYELEQLIDVVSKWQATGTYYDIQAGEIRYFASLQVNSNEGEIDIVTNELFDTLVSETWRLKQNEETFDLYSIPEYIGANIEELIESNVLPALSFSSIKKSELPKDPDTGSYIYSESVIEKTNNVNLTYWHPAQKTFKYKLTIFNQGQEIFSRTESYSPTYVRLFDLKCPEETCPVQCQDKICCYSGGTPVNSFLLTESIYQ